MVKSFIQKLCENSISGTELALCVSSISDDLQSMIEKLSNLKIKDLGELVKKIKYDGDVDTAENLNQSLSEKLDTAIQTLSEIKSSIDNEIVNISQGNIGEDGAESDFEDDFGSDLDDDFEEFSDENEYGDSDEDEDLDFDNMDFGEVDREMK